MAMPYQGQQPGPQTYGGYGAYAQQPSLPIADLGNRAVAYVIDYAILMGAVIVLYIVAILLIVALKGVGAVLALLLYLLILVASISYHPYFEATRGGQTPGKKLRGIKVVKEDGSPCDWGAAWIRRLGLFIDGILLGFIPGYFIANGHPQRQRLGDQWAKTVVINASGLPSPGAIQPQAAYAPPPPQYQQAPPVYAQPYAQPQAPVAPQYSDAQVPAAPPANYPGAQNSPPPASPSAATQALPPQPPPAQVAPTAIPSPSAQTQAINTADIDFGPPPEQQGP